MNGFRLILAVVAVLLAQPALSDELRPGYLRCARPAPAPIICFSRFPRGGKTCGSRSTSNCPRALKTVGLPRASFSDGAYVERRTHRRDGGLAGQAVSIEGLSATWTDVLVRVESLEGAIQTERLSPTKTSFLIQAVPGSGEVAATYSAVRRRTHSFRLRSLVVCTGAGDAGRDWRRVAITVTAFTIAHSITLAAGDARFRERAGSARGSDHCAEHILVSVEILNARRGKPSLTARLPWLVALSFGLLHGFGFAGALAEVGLHQHAIPLRCCFSTSAWRLGSWHSWLRS